MNCGWLAVCLTVYRWPYAESEFRKPLKDRQEVIVKMPPSGAHETRTLEFDAAERLYVKFVCGLLVSAPRTRLSDPEGPFSALDLPVISMQTAQGLGL
jgi:Uma2 family endonuclease